MEINQKLNFNANWFLSRLFLVFAHIAEAYFNENRKISIER